MTTDTWRTGYTAVEHPRSALWPSTVVTAPDFWTVPLSLVTVQNSLAAREFSRWPRRPRW